MLARSSILILSRNSKMDEEKTRRKISIEDGNFSASRNRERWNKTPLHPGELN